MTARRRIASDGLIVGLIGYAAVALFYGAFDVLAARGTLHTVNMLGRAMFRGLRDPSVLQFPVVIDTTAILEYNVLHLAVAICIGLLVVSLVATAEAHPSRRGLVRFALIAGFPVTVAAVGAFTAPMRDVLPWWSIIVANAAAALLAGAFLVLRHPDIWRRLALGEA